MTGNAQRGTSLAVDDLGVPRFKKGFLEKASCVQRTLRDQFARLPGFLKPLPGFLKPLPGFLKPWRRSEPPTTRSRFDCSFANGMADEVSEYRGILMVRLGDGFVMQVRLQSQGNAEATTSSLAEPSVDRNGES
jgi:hypothetical protein